MTHEIQQILEAVAKQYPNLVYTDLKEGDRVQKSWGLNYIIDTIEIYKELGDFKKGKIPVYEIYNALEPSQRKIMELANGRSEVPFSEVYYEGIGECTEKAILTQLCAQKGRVSFLMNGCLILGGGAQALTAHAYNVVFKDEEPFLVDTQNPLTFDEEGNFARPYTALIVGLEEGEFKVPEEWQQGRIYTIN